MTNQDRINQVGQKVAVEWDRYYGAGYAIELINQATNSDGITEPDSVEEELDNMIKIFGFQIIDRCDLKHLKQLFTKDRRNTRRRLNRAEISFAELTGRTAEIH